MTERMDDMTRQEAAAAIELLVEMGADEVIVEEPDDRFGAARQPYPDRAGDAHVPSLPAADHRGAETARHSLRRGDAHPAADRANRRHPQAARQMVRVRSRRPNGAAPGDSPPRLSPAPAGPE